MKNSHHYFLIFLLVFSILFIPSCATVFNGTRAKVLISNDSVKEPVTIIADNKHYNNVILPCKIKVKRGFRDSIVTITPNSHEHYDLKISKIFNATYIANVLFPMGFLIDAATEVIMKPEHKSYCANLIGSSAI